MPDEKDKTETQGADGSQAGAEDESSTGATDKSKTVPLQALQEERSKRKALQARLDALEGKSSKNGEQAKSQKIRLDVKDLMDLTPQKLEDHLNAIHEDAVRTALEMVDQRTTEFQNRSATDKVLAKFAIYQDEDKRLANAAIADIAERMKEDPDKSFEDVARETALYWSKYKVARAQADKGGKAKADPKETLPSAGGGAGVSHLKEERKVATSFDDVSAQADKRAIQLQNERSARGE